MTAEYDGNRSVYAFPANSPKQFGDRPVRIL